MSNWTPCVKCGTFVSIGMGDDSSRATCLLCGEDDDKFYHGDKSIEEEQAVEGKHFKGIVKHLGMETQVEIKQSHYYDEGEQIHLDDAYLKPIDQATLD